ncbi:Exodeoxyribonuclease III [hydrothermal vent metagenome]|uniref:Exodeoxyribonuclease III n=1 Tax=hydrothermal vent metagenome TaxID=652676 RepID=A0A3B0TEP2_9ZZZZ
MPVKIATWNINGIKARLQIVLDWLADTRPDIACLQEIKTIDENFPKSAFEDLGYNVATHGQKSYNGVAILSRLPLEDVTPGLPGNPDDQQARYLEATVSTQTGALRLASIYLPNGNPVDSDKFPYKLGWMERLERHGAQRLELEEAFALCGDYNAIPRGSDVHDAEGWEGDALYCPQTRKRFRALSNLGLTDAITAVNPRGGQYTFWDFQRGAWAKDHGIRIDHILLSPQAADRLRVAGIDKALRGRETPSDHVPVWAELEI